MARTSSSTWPLAARLARVVSPAPAWEGDEGQSRCANQERGNVLTDAQMVGDDGCGIVEVPQGERCQHFACRTLGLLLRAAALSVTRRAGPRLEHGPAT